MKRLFLIPLLSVVLAVTNLAYSSVRTDVEDRPRQDVFEKALELGESLGSADSTCYIICGKEMGTGVILDPYTVLTCAHTFFQAKDAAVEVMFGANPFNERERNIYTKTKSGMLFKTGLACPPIIHDSFNFFESLRELKVIYGPGVGYVDGQPIDEMDYYQLTNAGINHLGKFEGVDLAILKLKEPFPVLPMPLKYPTILSADFKVEKTYGVFLGYGPMRFNFHPNVPVQVTELLSKICKRHAVSCKVSEFAQDDACVLYGSYKTLAVNGDESFIPEASMMKTEGLPVAGDSGGPIFIKHENKYQLAGILSLTRSFQVEPITDPSVRKHLGQAITPVFPVWVDIRRYKDWIEQHMGPILK